MQVTIPMNLKTVLNLYGVFDEDIEKLILNRIPYTNKLLFDILDRDIIIEYIRDKKNNPVGVLVAVVDPSDPRHRFLVGYSLCNTAAGDVFDKKEGIGLALQRAIERASLTQGEVPHTVDKLLDAFLERAYTYFKGMRRHITIGKDKWI